jgi:RimJ/RimL family protein N-acetyltransferase
LGPLAPAGLYSALALSAEEAPAMTQLGQLVAEGELVRLRPIEAADWAGMFAVASDPLIWEVHPEQDRYKEENFRLFFDGALSSGMGLTILDRASGEIIGSSRYHGFDPELSEVEIGWTFIARRCWGGAYNREIKRLMLDHAFQFADTVVFWVGERNWRSQKAMSKIGGVLRSGMRDRAYRGRNARHVIFEIRKPRSA